MQAQMASGAPPLAAREKKPRLTEWRGADGGSPERRAVGSVAHDPRAPACVVLEASGVDRERLWAALLAPLLRLPAGGRSTAQLRLRGTCMVLRRYHHLRRRGHRPCWCRLAGEQAHRGHGQGSPDAPVHLGEQTQPHPPDPERLVTHPRRRPRYFTAGGQTQYWLLSKGYGART